MPLKEDLLQHLWHTLSFRKAELRQLDGEKITIGSPGKINFNQGPDFFDARIYAGNLLLAGCVELHVNRSGWFAHKHHLDPRYNNVILHVFWHNDTDKPCAAENGRRIPELDLSCYVSTQKLELHKSIMESDQQVPCGKNAPDVPRFHIKRWLHSVGAERITAKAGEYGAEYPQFSGDWRKLLFIKLAGAFGAKVNKQPFEQMACKIPAKALAYCASDQGTADALFFGTAGFLENLQSGDENYLKTLVEHWRFLRNKYDVAPMNARLFSLARIRPMNFPELRIAQLSAFICALEDITALMFSAEILYETLPKVRLHAFWRNHYRLDKPAKAAEKKLTNAFADLIFINVLAPMRLLYAKSAGKTEENHLWFERLEQIKAEQNSRVKSYAEAGIRAENALESQAILHLEKNYCSRKKCLHCGIGHQIFKQIQ